MSFDKVGADGEAVRAAQQMQSIITNDLQGSITKLNQQAGVLSDPTHFEGPLAQKFRGQVWPEASRTLEKVRGDLETLRQEVQSIVQSIIDAGTR